MNPNERGCTGRPLSPRQEAAALSLAMGSSQMEAAASSGAKTRTIKAWQLLPQFRRRIEQLRADMTERALGVLADNAASAALTLGYLSRKAESERARIAAAKAVLEMLLRVRESIALEERVRALEEAQLSKGRMRAV